MKKLRQLMRKDWRVNRATVIGLLVAIISSYAFAGAAYLWDRYETVVVTPIRPAHFEAVPVDIEIGAPLSSYLRTAAAAGLMFATLAAAVFGAGAFALERREKSADFLAMLPVKRGEIIASKLLVAFGILAVAMAIEMNVLVFSDFQREWETLTILLTQIFNFIASGLAIFGVAWLLSTFISSTAIAASVAVAAAGCASLIYSIVWRIPNMPMESVEVVMCMLCATGLVFVLVGSVYYLQRVAP